MLKFILIGLMCNSTGCYWAKASDTVFTDFDSCITAASQLKVNSVMYFSIACMVKEEIA